MAVRAGLTILATSNTAQGITSLGPCVFRDSLAEEQVVPEAVAKAISRWKVKTAALIYGDDDQFTKSDYDIFKSALDAQHIAIVAFLTPTNHGLIPATVDAPEYRANARYLTRLLEGRGVRVLDFDAAIPSADFIDNDHLTAAGQEKLASLFRRSDLAGLAAERFTRQDLR